MESLLFAFAIVAYLAAAIVWPTLRVWRRHGIWPIVFDREAAPAQRLLGLLFATLLAGLLVLAILRVTVGAEALGVWRLPVAVRIAGWLLLASGAALTLLAQQHMGGAWRIGIDDRPTDLITGGLFRYIRNPIFTGMLLDVAGIVALSPAWWSIAICILLVLGVRLQVTWEERHLIALHGDAYLAYAARVGRFVPLVGRLSATRTVRAERAPAATRG